MTCNDVADSLLAYTTGELDDRVRGTFEHHLHLCPNCREYLAVYCATVTLGRHACDETTNALGCGVPEELVAVILASAASRGAAGHTQD